MFKKNKLKKRSVIDYYTILMENLIEYFADEAKKVTETLEATYLEAKEVYRKTDKILIDSKKMIAEQVIYH